MSKLSLASALHVPENINSHGEPSQSDLALLVNMCRDEKVRCLTNQANHPISCIFQLKVPIFTQRMIRMLGPQYISHFRSNPETVNTDHWTVHLMIWWFVCKGYVLWARLRRVKNVDRDIIDGHDVQNLIIRWSQPIIPIFLFRP